MNDLRDFATKKKGTNLGLPLFSLAFSIPLFAILKSVSIRQTTYPQWHHLLCHAYGGQPFRLPPGFSHAVDAFFHGSSQPHRHQDALLSPHTPPAAASSASFNPRELTPRNPLNRRRHWVSWRRTCLRGQPPLLMIMPRRVSSPRRALRV